MYVGALLQARTIGMFAAVITNIALLGGYEVRGWGSAAGAVALLGFMAAAAYAATRNLWVPIGVHFGWNFAQGGIFSTSVSGKDAPQVSRGSTPCRSNREVSDGALV